MIIMSSVVAYILTGIVSGILAGLFGIGGGVFIVPALANIFLNMEAAHASVLQLAAGTAFAVMVVTATVSSYTHLRHKNIDFSMVKKLLPGILIGVVLGAVLAKHTDSFWLSRLFGLFLLSVAVHLIIKSVLKREIHPPRWPRLEWIIVFAFCMGILSGMLGIGSGSLLIPFLLRFGVPLQRASGISTLCMLPIAIVGTCSFIVTGWGYDTGLPYTTGYIYWPAWGIIACLTSITAPLGILWAKHLSPTMLKNLFIVLLIALASNMLV